MSTSLDAGVPQFWPAVVAIVVVFFLLALFILPDYICWKRRIRSLPSVVAHQIQFVDEATCLQALALLKSTPSGARFDKFCEISRALTKTKERRAGHDGLLFDGEFQIGSMPQEYEALERALFAYKNDVDDVVGPVQTHADAFHLGYIVSRRDPIADKRREALEKKLPSTQENEATAGSGAGSNARKASANKKKHEKKQSNSSGVDGGREKTD